MSTGFAQRVLAWGAVHGRRGLPWQGQRDPYRVWVSEIVLQQTPVATAVPYYRRVLERFPTVRRLAAAPLTEVMPLWAGLGYYARARNLHRCAKVVVAEYGGRFPRSVEALAALPGVGRSTAAAIAAFCFDVRAPILDGNVKRVLARHDGVEGFPGAAPVERELWRLAERRLPPAARMPAYTQAIMDLGAAICTRRAPRCADCPLRATCVARREGRVEQLPAPRPARTRRVERVHWLIVVQRGRVLLERRPPHGIWGGLLAPPQFARPTALRRAAAAVDAAAALHPLPARRHALTHCILEFTPYLVRPRTRPTVQAPRQWLPLRAVGSAALPAPVRSLLSALAPAAVRGPRAASGSG